MLETLLQDVRYAARILRRRPGFTIAATLTLTLGIGANTAVFSLLNALMLRALPVERPAELVRLVEQGADPASYRDTFTLDTHANLQRGTRALSGVLASSIVRSRPATIEERGEKSQAVVQMVSDNYFDVLGVDAFAGRAFHQPAAGSAGEPIAVISDEYWRRHHSAEPSAIGARFRFNSREFTIAGIAPRGFRGAEVDVPIDIWVPLEQVVPADSTSRTRGRWMRVMGRLQPGVTAAAAAAEASASIGRPVKFEAGDIGYSTLRRRLSRPLTLVALVVGLVLLLTCANLANLMLGATAARERELALRRAVGASRLRVVRQLLTESVLLTAAGALLAVVVAYWISAALLGFLPPEQAVALPNLRFGLDRTVLTFTAVVACGTCLLFGLLPALRATSRTATAQLRAAGSGQRTRSWLSRGLLVTQVVVCSALLTIAGVFLRTVENLRGQDSGYRESHLVVADVEPPFEYPEPERDRLIETLRARAAALPGVEIAAFSYIGQLSGSALEYRIGFPGQPASAESLAIEQRISPGFLPAMGTAFVAGRDVSLADDASAPPVAIVNEAFVRRFLKGREPIGVRFFQEGGSRGGESMEIVGVVRDSKWVNLRDDYPAMYYRPYDQQAGSPSVRFAIRTSADADALAASLVQIAQTLDRRLVLRNVVPFREIVNRTLVIERLVAQVSAAFGALALLIAAVGLYGVLTSNVVRRRREIGIRMAVGADRRTVVWMVLRESLVLLACGAAIGLPAAIAGARLVSSMLFGLSPHDPVTVASTMAVLCAATIGAAYLPARRAASVDPMLALRDE